MYKALGASVLLLLCGCMPSAFTAKTTLLPEVEQFNNGIRWEHYDEVSARLAPAVRAHYMDRLNSMGDNLEIMDSEITRINLDPSGKKATVRVEISWSDKRRGLLEHTSVAQTWERTASGLNWVVAKQVRAKGAPMFLFDEPPVKRAPDPQPQPAPEQKTEPKTDEGSGPPGS